MRPVFNHGGSRPSFTRSEGVVTLPTKGSAYSDPSFMNAVTEGLLLPADLKRLNEIRPVKSSEWS